MDQDQKNSNRCDSWQVPGSTGQLLDSGWIPSSHKVPGLWLDPKVPTCFYRWLSNYHYWRGIQWVLLFYNLTDITPREIFKWGKSLCKQTCLKKKTNALLVWLSWLGIFSQSQRSPASSTPSQGTYLSCVFSPWLGCIWEAIDRYFSPFLSPLLPLSVKNE